MWGKILGSRSSAKNVVQDSAQFSWIPLTSNNPPRARPHAVHGPANLFGNSITRVDVIVERLPGSILLVK